MFDKVFTNYINYLHGLRKDPNYKLSKKFLYMTPLQGPHLDFYNNPLGFNGKTLEEKIKNLKSKFIKAMTYIQLCEEEHIYINEVTVRVMLNQLTQCLSNRDYWTRCGFNDVQVNRIYLIYEMLVKFIQDYQLKNMEISKVDGMGKSSRGNRFFKFLFELNTSIAPDILDLQKYAIRKLEENLRKLYNQDSLVVNPSNIKTVAINVTDTDNDYVESKKELLITAKEKLMKIYEIIKTKQYFNKSIKIPSIDKITIKPDPSILSKWKSKKKPGKNTIYIDTDRFNKVKKNQIPQLVAKEGIPGELLFKNNNRRALDKIKLKGETMHMIYRGVKMILHGWEMYCQELVLEAKDSKYVTMDHILNCVRAIVDIGMNYEGSINFTIEEAKQLYKKMTILDDEEIDSELVHCLSHPSEQSLHVAGYHYICKLIEEFDGKLDRKIIYSYILKSPLNARELHRFINSVYQKKLNKKK